MIDKYNDVIIYLIHVEHELHYVNKDVNNPTSLQINNITVEILFFYVYFGKLFNFNIFILI